MDRWPHAPPHWTHATGVYIVTASTYQKKLLLNSREKLDEFQDLFLEALLEFDIKPHAWAIFSNHYHVVLENDDQPQSIESFVARLHNRSSTRLNKRDHVEGRQVWFQYRDTRLSYQKSYLARLAYVTRNPVKHRITTDPRAYPWCSAHWLEQRAPRSLYETLMAMKIDRVKVWDDFD